MIPASVESATREPWLDLRREVARAPLSLAGHTDLTEDERAHAIQNWRDRMVSEHVSARVFAALVPQLMAASVERRHVVAAGAMIGQELDHALSCARAVAALGGDASAPLPVALPDVPNHQDAPPLEALLRNVLSVSCLSETVAVALVAADRERAATPELERLLRGILSDEVRHARLGYRLLDELAPRIDAALRARLGAYLVVALEHQIDFHAPFLSMPSASPRAVSYGAPHGESNFRVFFDAITSVVIPALEKRGLPAREAWSAALERHGARESARHLA